MIRLLLLVNLLNFAFCGNIRQKDLSDVQQHVEAHIHDLEYDHKAFLGKDESDKYLELTAEESKLKLKKLVENKVDVNKDGKVTKSELKEWISYVSKKWMLEERDRVWNDFNPGNGTHIDFKSYLDINFGENMEEQYNGDELKQIMEKIQIDKQKWKLADEDNNGLIDREEFFAFIRPEEVTRMKPFLIDEILARADKNNDNYIDIDEYTDELYTREPNLVRGKDPEPEWIKHDLENFSFDRDMNDDRKLDRNEIGEWVMPSDYDGIESEAYHLIAKADADKDGDLSIDEILDKSDLFAGSQGTNFGSTFNDKDEL